MIYRVFGVLILAAAAGIALQSLNSDEKCVQLTPAQQFAKMISSDFEMLEKNKELPPQWKNIAKVEFHVQSSLAKAILGKQLPYIRHDKNGTTSLELEFMDLPDEENPGVIIQASLFDIKTKNKIFEIGRTYNMNKLNQQSPEKSEE